MTETFVHKSEKIAEIGREAGWQTKIIPDMTGDEIIWNIFFVRKPEAMKVTYTGNRMTFAQYVIGDKRTNPAHKAAVVKILMGKPNLSGMNGSALAAHKSVPFDPEDVLPSRILGALLGKKITWLNSLSTELESATIELHRNKGSRYYRIFRTRDKRRYIEFVTSHGFRSVYLDAIVTAH